MTPRVGLCALGVLLDGGALLLGRDWYTLSLPVQGVLFAVAVVGISLIAWSTAR